MSEENRVEFGVENLHLALWNEGNYEAPEKIEGTVEMKLTAKGDLKVLHADNGVFYTVSSNNGYEGELQIYNFSDNFKVKYLGFERDGNGVLVEPNVMKPAEVAMLFKILGDEKDRCSVMYNVVFEKPDIELKTLEDKIEIPVAKMKFKASPKEFSTFDKKVIQASTIIDKVKEKFFTAVYLPSKTKTIEG